MSLLVARRPRVVPLASAISLVVLGACRSKAHEAPSPSLSSAAQSSSSPSPAAALPSSSSLPVQPARVETHVFRGSLGKGTGFRLYVERTGDVLSGVYDLDGAGAAVSVRGRVKGAAWHLEEPDGDRGVRQTFDLTLDAKGGLGGTVTDAKTHASQVAHAEPNVPFADAKDFTQAYVGSIGGKLRIRASLSRSGNTLHGSYRYTRSTSELTLSGTVDARTGELDLTESAGGKTTGKMHGFFVDQALVVGRWSMADGSNALPLVLEGADDYPTAVALDGGGKVVPQEDFAAPTASCTSSIVYPALEGLPAKASQAKLNPILKKEATNGLGLGVEDCKSATPDLPYNVEGTYSVVAKKGFVGVDLTGYGFTGGAHGMTWQTCFVLDLAKGEKFSLLRLFTPSGRARLDTLVQEKLRKEHGVDHLTEAGLFDDHPKVSDTTSLCLRPGGFDVNFGDYEIAPHAVGPQEASLTTSELRPLLTPGPITDALLAP